MQILYGRTQASEVFHSLWALAMITMLGIWAQCQAINMQVMRGRSLVQIPVALWPSVSLEASVILSAFPLVAGVPHAGESQVGSGYVVSQRKWTYSLIGALRRL